MYKPTNIPFIRQNGWRGIDQLLVVCFTHAETLRSAAEVLSAFKNGITEWIKTTKEGREVWDDSSDDLNIGDMAGYEYDRDLRTILQKHGILSWEIVFELTESNQVSYDEVLANADELED